ncbi:MAG: hypothetical protein E6G64_14610 [Actinobacteria bacterium]|nr:MAG: hypothetical protein E6G64_14610 [Actinomycetota bacterium]
MTAREAAYDVVLRVFEEDAYADRVLRSSAAGLDARDRALAQRLAYGTVQRVRTLDHAIEQLGRRPVRKLDPPVRAALRLGAYQLGYAEGIPPHAAVNETVELVRRARLERAVAFTNAVMRRLADGMRELLDSLPEGPLKHSYPDWIADVWMRDFGTEDALALMRAQNEPAETVVRLVRGDPPGEPTDIQRTLDLCAAPGGKATQLAGEVVAVELHEARARELEENIRLLGADNVTVVHADARALPSTLIGFDHVLVDAPCSGLGVLAARPDLRWRAQPLPELQLDLLRAAAERARPGGTIVYSVCTMNADENEAVVEASGLQIEPLGGEWPQFAHPRRPEFLLTLPHVHGTSGFFIARLTP